MSNAVYRVYVIELAPASMLERTVPQRKVDCPTSTSARRTRARGSSSQSIGPAASSRGPVFAPGASVCGLYKPIRPLRTRDASRKAEAALATALAERGHCVFGGH